MLAHHVLPNGLEIRFDLSTGRNFARLPQGAPAAQGDGSDEASVVKLLCDAATWGKQALGPWVKGRSRSAAGACGGGASELPLPRRELDRAAGGGGGPRPSRGL